jgi:hypothetical protein
MGDNPNRRLSHADVAAGNFALDPGHRRAPTLLLKQAGFPMRSAFAKALGSYPIESLWVVAMSAA